MGEPDPGALLHGLSPAQRQAVTSPAAPLCILAGAGSGKTRVLTRRIAYRIATGQATAERTMAVTFTRRAASELRRRLRALGVDGVAAGTIHSLAFAHLQRWWRDHDRPVPKIIDNSFRRLTDDEKRRRGVLDFDDLLVQFAEAVAADPAFAEAVRWFRRHLYVDEFQDVTPAQLGAVQAWLGDGTDLTVVGDPNQAIYGWNGADPRLLTDLSGRATTIRLDANYRSTAAIVRAAAAVLPDARPAPTEHDGPAPTVTGHATAAAEAAAVARGARLAHAPNTPWSSIAVLARTNAQLDVLAAALDAAGIPFRHAGKVAMLNRPAVRDALTRDHRHLRALAHDCLDPADADALLELADLADEFESLTPGAGSAAFLAWLPTTKLGDPLRRDAVELATFHKAKGLEWRTVFLAGVEDGLVPLPHGDPAEERRLLYVAMTRAERALHISHVGPRSPLLPDDLGAADPAAAPGPAPAHVDFAALRRALAEAS
jgi:DNA helicase-2/ATP-dependent DNA helicase PcrA